VLFVKLMLTPSTTTIAEAVMTLSVRTSTAHLTKRKMTVTTNTRSFKTVVKLTVKTRQLRMIVLASSHRCLLSHHCHQMAVTLMSWSLRIPIWYSVILKIVSIPTVKVVRNPSAFKTTQMMKTMRGKIPRTKQSPMKPAGLPDS